MSNIQLHNDMESTIINVNQKKREKKYLKVIKAIHQILNVHEDTDQKETKLLISAIKNILIFATEN